jgi:hypothetical protein
VFHCTAGFFLDPKRHADIRAPPRLVRFLNWISSEQRASLSGKERSPWHSENVVNSDITQAREHMLNDGH